MDAAKSWAEVGERIAEARLAAGLSQGDLATRIDLDRTAIVRIEAGDRRITALELFRLAEALGVPLAHLVSRPPQTLVSRRSALEETPDEASRDRYRLDARLEEHARRAQWLVDHGFLSPPVPDLTVQRTADTIDPVALATAARRAAGCPSGPLGAMADVLERMGLYLTAVDEEAEGASLLLQGYGVAVISGRAQPGRRRWTAVHELGHHLMQDEYHSDAGVAAGRDERERLIDQFVEEFLLPAADMRAFWRSQESAGTPRATMIDLSASYRISWSAVVRRARHLHLIDPDEARRYKADAPVRGDFLAAHGSQPIPDLEIGVTGTQWRQATLSAWSQGAVTAPRAVELLYGALTESELPGRNLEESLP
ncbi:helix-turn-helix domain-containing protein [Streptomyces sp. NBC_01476]|uniref:helix-turn-helix domain-containing protein n=1 Tax=Streptomyces sp. NBC_01476 TaxID=2903881 RepID=UPI002E37A478|nr:helix-turn-helix domain-containing protein [Streptomyces sp. NBC_01476]